MPDVRSPDRRPRRSTCTCLAPATVLLVLLTITLGCGRDRSGTAGTASASAGTAPARPTDGGVETNATVVRVVDGDTIVIDRGAGDETVRLIGIDTPETKKPDTPVECFGPEASDRLHALLPGGTAVRLERDDEERDRYDRLLAYAYRDDGLFVNLAMVADGYAGTLAIPPNVTFADQFASAADGAARAGTGLWGTCGGNHLAAG